MSSVYEPHIFIIVLNWNGAEDTCECLHSLQQLHYTNYSIVVVDNASTDDSMSRISSEFPNVHLIEQSENNGYAGGNNVGMRYALENEADYIWVLNNDTVVDAHALQPLVEKMEGDSRLGICGSKLVYYHQRNRVQALGGGKFYPWIGYTQNLGQGEPVNAVADPETIESNLDFIVGASLFIARSFINDNGLMDESYFLYYEELDWALRAKEKYHFGFASDSIIYHKEGASTKATARFVNEKSRMADYYAIKNRLKITYKFNPVFLPTVYLVTLYAIFNRMKRRQWDRIPMILKLLVTFNSSRRYQG